MLKPRWHGERVPRPWASGGTLETECSEIVFLVRPRYGLAHSARHVTGRHSTQHRKIQNALVDVASNICRALPRGWS